MGFSNDFVTQIDTESYGLARGEHNEPPFAAAPVLAKKYMDITTAKLLVNAKHICHSHGGRLCYIVSSLDDPNLAGEHVEMSHAMASAYAKTVVCECECGL